MHKNRNTTNIKIPDQKHSLSWSVLILALATSCTKQYNFKRLSPVNIIPKTDEVTVKICADAPEERIPVIKYIIAYDDSTSNYGNNILYPPDTTLVIDCPEQSTAPPTVRNDPDLRTYYLNLMKYANDTSTKIDRDSAKCPPSPNIIDANRDNVFKEIPGRCTYNKLATDPCLSFRLGTKPSTTPSGTPESGTGLRGFLDDIINNRLSNKTSLERQFLIMRWSTTQEMLKKDPSPDTTRASSCWNGSTIPDITPTRLPTQSMPFQPPDKAMRSIDICTHGTTNASKPLGGSTDFIEAFKNIAKIVLNDLGSNLDTAKAQKKVFYYVIVFLTDGLPIPRDPVSPPADNPNGPQKGEKQELGSILESIQKIMAIKTQYPDYKNIIGNINIYPVYYFFKEKYTIGTTDIIIENVDPGARELMASIADAGNGFATTLNSGETLDFSRFQLATFTPYNSITDVLITNNSLIFLENGDLKPDQDGDGLDDATETSLNAGFNPQKYDSIFEGVSDLIVHNLQKKLPPSEICNTTDDCLTKLIKGINSTETLPIKCQLPARQTHEKTYNFNPCEKAIIAKIYPEINNVFSNTASRYLLPTMLAYKNNVPINQWNANSALYNNQTNDLSIYDRIKQSLPPFGNIGAAKPTEYTTTTTYENNKTCYQVKAEKLPRLKNLNIKLPDTIRVDVLVQNPYATGEGQSFLWTAQKEFPTNATELTIEGWETGSPDASLWKKSSLP